MLFHRTVLAMLTTIHFSTLFVTLARYFMDIPELGMTILVWLALIVAAVIICTFIGSVIFRLMNSRVLTFGLDAVKSMADYLAQATSTKSTVIR